MNTDEPLAGLLLRLGCHQLAPSGTPSRSESGAEFAKSQKTQQKQQDMRSTSHHWETNLLKMLKKFGADVGSIASGKAALSGYAWA